jgi:hypothetical protein
MPTTTTQENERHRERRLDLPLLHSVFWLAAPYLRADRPTFGKDLNCLNGSLTARCRGAGIRVDMERLPGDFSLRAGEARRLAKLLGEHHEAEVILGDGERSLDVRYWRHEEGFLLEGPENRDFASPVIRPETGISFRLGRRGIDALRGATRRSTKNGGTGVLDWSDNVLKLLTCGGAFPIPHEIAEGGDAFACRVDLCAVRRLVHGMRAHVAELLVEGPPGPYAATLWTIEKTRVNGPGRAVRRDCSTTCRVTRYCETLGPAELQGVRSTCPDDPGHLGVEPGRRQRDPSEGQTPIGSSSSVQDDEGRLEDAFDVGCVPACQWCWDSVSDELEYEGSSVVIRAACKQCSCCRNTRIDVADLRSTCRSSATLAEALTDSDAIARVEAGKLRTAVGRLVEEWIRLRQRRGVLVDLPHVVGLVLTALAPEVMASMIGAPFEIAPLPREARDPRGEAHFEGEEEIEDGREDEAEDGVEADPDDDVESGPDVCADDDFEDILDSDVDCDAVKESEDGQEGETAEEERAFLDILGNV